MAMAKDPVCGMEVNEQEAIGRLEYEGKPYFFCSAVCMDEFKDNPEGVLAGDSDSGMRDPTRRAS
jgi:P-type Cu+ transporter